MQNLQQPFSLHPLQTVSENRRPAHSGAGHHKGKAPATGKWTCAVRVVLAAVLCLAACWMAVDEVGILR